MSTWWQGVARTNLACDQVTRGPPRREPFHGTGAAVILRDGLGLTFTDHNAPPMVADSSSCIEASEALPAPRAIALPLRVRAR